MDLTRTDLTGEMLIGAHSVRGTEAPVRAIEAASGETIGPDYAGADTAQVERACALAWAAFDRYRETGLEDRARFLEASAQSIVDIGDALVERACAETGLPRGRIEGERARTVGQLRLFAQVVREGSWIGARIDPALPDRAPLPRPDLRLRHVALGPVVVFGASNFPLAFSVAGGDTASALAAGCPVIVKAHRAHPGTSELVGRAIQRAAVQCGMPEGVFSLVFGAGSWVGTALVADWRVKAVGFTGSRAGGQALMRVAAGRPEPIPVYAEMSSINPVILLPGALAARAEAIAKGFIGSLTLGAGQFCTNPGLILALDGKGLDDFLASAERVLGASPAATMLHPGIFQAYQEGVRRLEGNSHVRLVARGLAASGANCGQSALFETTGRDFLADPALREEVFGASSLVVRCRDLAEVAALVEAQEGHLTLTLHMEDADLADARALLPVLERKAGRVLVNGWPTGVEVCHAMVHGGPYPATSDSRATSVGTLAIRRFLRPVCYQNMPEGLLPEVLRDGNPAHIWRRVDGRLTAPGA